jgi:hypothetical protein
VLPASLIAADKPPFIPSLGTAIQSARPEDGGLASGIVNTSFASAEDADQVLGAVPEKGLHCLLEAVCAWHFWVPTNGIVSASPRLPLVLVATAQVTLGRP